MPLDYERMLQYQTPFRCPECGERTFQTDAVIQTEFTFIEAECTNCGHPLTREEISAQLPVAAEAWQKTLAQFRAQ